MQSSFSGTDGRQRASSSFLAPSSETLQCATREAATSKLSQKRTLVRHLECRAYPGKVWLLLKLAVQLT